MLYNVKVNLISDKKENIKYRKTSERGIKHKGKCWVKGGGALYKSIEDYKVPMLKLKD